MANSDGSEVTLGVDTHLDTHVAAAVDARGVLLAVRSFAATALGARELIEWAHGLGLLRRAGVEGTGTYGAGLTRALRAAGVEVRDVHRPDCSLRRRKGKSDTIDAEQAARSVWSGSATAHAKSRTGLVEATRGVVATRRSAVKARTQAANQLRAMIVAAPDDLRDSLQPLPLLRCVRRCAALRPGRDLTLDASIRRTLRLLAKRWQHLSAELTVLDEQLEALTAQIAPRLRERYGVGPHTAAVLLLTAGDNPERLATEASLAALCGASPLEASSGRTVRHRLNRGGDRQANNALFTIAMTRMRGDARTKAYVDRRRQEGKTIPEIRRCLKRYIVREIYPLLVAGSDAVLAPG
jgi:transposase